MVSNPTPLPPKVRGPRSNELILKVYTTAISQWGALLAGDIDIMDLPIPDENIPEALSLNSTGDLVVGAAPAYEVWWWEIGVTKEPTNYLAFRKALAHLVNKPAAQEAGAPYGIILDTSVSPLVYADWWWSDVPAYDNVSSAFYYSASLANQSLYDGGFYVDGTGKWCYPNSTQIPEGSVIVGIREDRDEMKGMGDTFELEIKALDDAPGWGNFYELFTFEHKTRPYFSSGGPRYIGSGLGNVGLNMYTGGWGLTLDPDHNYWFAHSDMPYIYNHAMFANDTFDYWAEILEMGTINETEAIEACWKTQEIMYEQLPYIPLFAKVEYFAARPEWEGYFSPPGGMWNGFTLANVNPNGTVTYGGTFRSGLHSGPTSLNPVIAEWVYEWEILGFQSDSMTGPFISMMFSRDPTNKLPYNWTATEWEITLYNGTLNNWSDGMNLTYTIRDDATFHDGVTVKAEDIVFTYQFLKNKPRWSPSFEVIANVTSEGNTVSVYTTDKGYFRLFLLDGIILPKHIWLEHAGTYNATTGAYDGGDWETWDVLSTTDANGTAYGTYTHPLTGETVTLKGGLIGHGPWVFAEAVAGEFYRLVSYEDFFASYPGKVSPLSVQVSPSTLIIGEELTVSGTVTPALANEKVILNYTLPDDTVFTRVVYTTSGGAFSDTFNPGVEDSWSVEATWLGQRDSATFEVTVAPPPYAMYGGMGVLAVIAIAAIAYAFIWKR
jgi:ABC-type transport system substrate-binding protein